MSNKLSCLRGLTALSLLAPAIALQGATLCVNSGGTSGCFAHINDAISSASAASTIKIAPGTYKEAVVITKSLSLVGENGTIIDATGLPVGIFVNGLAATGLSDVFITGLTIENANFEGILIANASAVTASSNQVLNNNKARSGGACPGLPSFETNEQDDCGEGIHLLGADHAIIANNVVEGNAGGILLSDDTGATHDNLISGNTVRDNPYDCGITLASHIPAPLTGSPSALGVYHNTVLSNRSARNGLASGGGAGIGMFASVPGAKTYGNVVVNNLVNENGLPGIAMHAHVPGQDLSNNVIAGNTVVNNGPDFEDAATPGPTGINVYGAGDVTGTIISGNSIQSESVGIAIHTPARVQAHLNSLLGLETGLANLGSGTVGASANWWGCDAGPGAQGCSNVQGPGVDFAPWLTTPIPAQSSY